jgi:magnesium/cobalt transport protein CorA
MAETEFLVLDKPSQEELLEKLSGVVPKDSAQRLADRFISKGVTRASLRQEGNHIFGSLVLPECLVDEDRVIYEQIDLIITSTSVFVIADSSAYVASSETEMESWAQTLKAACPDGKTENAGRIIHRLFDSAVDRYESLAVDLELEIDEVESSFESWSGEQVQVRLRELRNDLLRSRRNLVPLREGLRRIADDEIDLDSNRFFSRDIDIRFRDTYERVIRVNESLDSLRDYVAGVRDAHQAHVAQKQNEVMQRLTVIASILLVPTLIVGIYGQNFSDIPETRWTHGYAWSWGLIVLITIGQLIFFKRKGYFGTTSAEGSEKRKWRALRREGPKSEAKRDPKDDGEEPEPPKSPEKDHHQSH